MTSHSGCTCHGTPSRRMPGRSIESWVSRPGAEAVTAARSLGLLGDGRSSAHVAVWVPPPASSSSESMSMPSAAAIAGAAAIDASGADDRSEAEQQADDAIDGLRPHRGHRRRLRRRTDRSRRWPPRAPSQAAMCSISDPARVRTTQRSSRRQSPDRDDRPPACGERPRCGENVLGLSGWALRSGVVQRHPFQLLSWCGATGGGSGITHIVWTRGRRFYTHPLCVKRRVLATP